MTTEPLYSALTEAFEHSVAAVAAESLVVVTGYLLQQQSAVHRSGPGPGGRPALDLGQRVYYVYSGAVAQAGLRQVTAAAGNIPPRVED